MEVATANPNPHGSDIGKNAPDGARNPELELSPFHWLGVPAFLLQGLDRGAIPWYCSFSWFADRRGLVPLSHNDTQLVEPLEGGAMDYAKKLRKIASLRWACRAVVAAATATSVWSNSLVAQNTKQSLIIVIMAPLIVLIGFELVSRIPLSEASWTIRLTRPVATAAITGGGAYLSYWHQRDAFMKYSGDPQTAYILPGLIDGLMVVAAVSLIELNALYEKTEARQAGLNVQLKREPVQATKVRAVTGKERVAQVLAKQPDITIKRLAIEAGVSEGYAGTLAGQLRRTQDAVLVD
jgi:hypothetical protein